MFSTKMNYAKLFANHPFRTELLKDPILCALMTRSISWGDLASDDVNTVKTVKIVKAVNVQHTPYVTWEVPTVMHIAKAQPIVQMQPVQITHPVQQVKPSNLKTIIVSNIPRYITKDEIIEVFSEFGAVQGAHLPKNTDQNSPYFGTLRGFAMVQYVDYRDAQRAYQMCSINSFYVHDNHVNVQMAKEDRVIYTVPSKK